MAGHGRWEYAFAFHAAFPAFDEIWGLQWHACSELQNRHFTGLWAEITSKREELGLAYACNIHRQGYTSVKYTFQGCLSLGK